MMDGVKCCFESCRQGFCLQDGLLIFQIELRKKMTYRTGKFLSAAALPNALRSRHEMKAVREVLMNVFDRTSDFSAESRYDGRIVAFTLNPLNTSFAVGLAVEIPLRSNTLDPLEVGNPAAAGDLLREFDNATQGADRIEMIWVWIHE